MKIIPFDTRRELIIPGDTTDCIVFSVDHWIVLCQKAIDDHGGFYVALSGGSTPKAIFEMMTKDPFAQQINWSKVHLFWSDERAVLPTDPDSNYHMAMKAGLEKMPIPSEQIHRMVTEKDLEANAQSYEKLIQATLKDRPFDLIMLGIGEDGHTASLFPHTQALKETHKLVVSNYVPDKKIWRMTMTYRCINQASHVALYVLGANKSKILYEVLTSSQEIQRLPSQGIGTETNPALWIVDQEACDHLRMHFPDKFNAK